MAKLLKIKNLFQGSEGEEGSKHPYLPYLIVALILAAALLVLNSPIFSLKTIEVEGNERVSTESILEDLELKEGINLFRYAISHLNAKVTMDSRLSSVDVYFRWPSGVLVSVEESETIGYVYFQGTYLCIDRKGQVASSTNEPDEDLPIIIGIEVGSFSIGESLNTRDAERYSAVVSVGSNIRKHDLSSLVNEVNVRSLADVILVTDKLEIHLGTMEDVDQKINIVSGVLAEPSVPEGILHLEDISGQIYIEPKLEESGPGASVPAGQPESEAGSQPSGEASEESSDESSGESSGGDSGD